MIDDLRHLPKRPKHHDGIIGAMCIGVLAYWAWDDLLTWAATWPIFR